MTVDEARPLLEAKLNYHWSENREECRRMAGALLDWYNRPEVAHADISRLFRLAMWGFEFWFCPACGGPVGSAQKAINSTYHGNWALFDRVLESNLGPPGGPNDLRCHFCRCHNVGEKRLGRALYGKA